MRPTTLIATALGALLFAHPLAAQGPTSRPKVTPQPGGASTPSTPTAKPPAPTPRTGAPKAGTDTSGAGAVTTAYLQGVAVDSIHGAPLIGAAIQLDGTDRLAITDSLGRFLIDSIKPGSYKVLVDHDIIDTLGISLSTAPMEFAANHVTRVVIAVPSSDFLVSRFCTPARRALGPGALVGRVREPDSPVAAVGARVSLVWYDPDPPAIAGVPIKIKKEPRVREATVGEDGTYRLCGLPEKYEGKLQAQRKDGGTTAEVSVTQDGGVLALRSMSVAPLAATAANTDTTKGAPARVAKGSARVSGRVTNKTGAPVEGARVSLIGGGASTTTRASGDFSLDSLPAGTQAIGVRHLGYAPQEVTVELSSRTPQRVSVQLGVYVPELAPMEVISQMDQGLDRVGFSGRKRGAAGGYFITPQMIENRKAAQFTDLLTTAPGIRIQGSMGHMDITSTRTVGRQGCVTVYVDGSQWQALQPGDLDSFVRPEEAAAIEVYPAGASTPVEFQTSGQDCASVVIWTKLNVNRKARSKK
ncbi:MAG TPA: carboxypeptidase regulatory-like domain-containing protein [Gemmatimonadaceae bacterium]